MSIRDFPTADNVCLIAMDEPYLGIQNEVSDRVYADTSGATNHHAWQRPSPFVSMDGAPIRFSQYRSIEFNGSNYAHIESADEGYDDISVSFWVEMGSLPASLACLFGKWRSGGSVNALIIGTNNNSGVKWTLSASNNVNALQSTFSTTAATTSLTHILWTATRNGSNLDLAMYVNGVAETLTTSTFVNTSLGVDQTSPWVLGADADGSFVLTDFAPNGTKIQDFCVWRNRTISPSEAASIYAAGLAGTPVPRVNSGLGASLRMAFGGDSVDPFPVDVSLNGNDGTLTLVTTGSSMEPIHTKIDALIATEYSMLFRGRQCIDLSDFGLADDSSTFIAFKLDNLSALRGLYGKHSTSDASVTEGHNLFQVWATASGAILVQLHGFPGEVSTAGGLLTAGMWHTVGVTLEAIGGVDTRIRIYLDGAEVADSTVAGRTVNNGPQTFTGAGRRVWTIGQDWDLTTRTDFFEGELMQFAAWNRTLGPDELVELDRLVREGPATLRMGLLQLDTYGAPVTIKGGQTGVVIVKNYDVRDYDPDLSESSLATYWSEVAANSGVASATPSTQTISLETGSTSSSSVQLTANTVPEYLEAQDIEISMKLNELFFAGSGEATDLVTVSVYLTNGTSSQGLRWKHDRSYTIIEAFGPTGVLWQTRELRHQRGRESLVRLAQLSGQFWISLNGQDVVSGKNGNALGKWGMSIENGVSGTRGSISFREFRHRPTMTLAGARVSTVSQISSGVLALTTPTLPNNPTFADLVLYGVNGEEERLLATDVGLVADSDEDRVKTSSGFTVGSYAGGGRTESRARKFTYRTPNY